MGHRGAFPNAAIATISNTIIAGNRANGIGTEVRQNEVRRLGNVRKTPLTEKLRSPSL